MKDVLPSAASQGGAADPSGCPPSVSQLDACVRDHWVTARDARAQRCVTLFACLHRTPGVIQSTLSWAACDDVPL